MTYFVDRVVICDAYAEPDQHYQLLAGGRSRLAPGRRPSRRFLASAREVRGGLEGVLGRQATLFEDMFAANEQLNDFVIQLRTEVREWRTGQGIWSGNLYGDTAFVTRRLLEWWFERDDERKAIGKRLFFCQREAIETVIYLFEVKNRYKMPETENLLRYALKLATGTGKTVVMAMLIIWSTLHRRKVSGSPLSSNFLVLTPNLTVRDRVSGVPRGDGLDPSGPENLYEAFDLVPPEYSDDFHPNIIVKNWQAIPLDIQRDDWLPDEFQEEGRFMPASILWALQRRARQDPNAGIRRLLRNWHDLIIINDEAHHVYGEKRSKKGEDPGYIKWSKIIDRINKVARIGLVVDLSATPWYGSGSPKPEGTLFEWLVSDFSVYDAFESGLVKVVRLPDTKEQAHIYLDLWDSVKDTKSKEEYLMGCKGAIASIYSDWSKDYKEWLGTFEIMRQGPAPALLIVADRAQRAEWLFEHLSKDYDLLHNADDDDPHRWVTIRIDSGVFDAEKGNEAVLREMVNTVGKKGHLGEFVRCIVSVNMLSEGWDVKSVTHILGLRAFGSPLLTEQIIGRGLRRTNYDILNQPMDERPEGVEETVDAFGIPFVGFPVEKRSRPRTGSWGKELNWIEKDASKHRYQLQLPNVRSWAVGVTQPLVNTIDIDHLPELVIDPAQTPATVRVRPVVGGNPEYVITLKEFRDENPKLKSILLTSSELFDLTNPGSAQDLGIGPTFDELLEVVTHFFDRRIRVIQPSDIRDVGIYYWRQKVLDILETAIRGAGGSQGAQAIPILGSPEYLDTDDLRRFQWTGIVAAGKKSPTNKVPCHTDLERQFADFLDEAKDVDRYFKNERFGFSITYYENNRPRQYYPDFIVRVREGSGRFSNWVVETKGEIRPNTKVKRETADLWCAKMTATPFGPWRHLFLQQQKFALARARNVVDFHELVEQIDRS